MSDEWLECEVLLNREAGSNSRPGSEEGAYDAQGLKHYMGTAWDSLMESDCKVAIKLLSTAACPGEAENEWRRRCLLLG